MKSGTLRHRVTVETPPVDEDTSGDAGDWTEIGQYKADINPLSQREQFLAEQQHASATHRIRFRFRPEFAALTGKERVKLGERIFVLVGLPINVDERNREIDLLCIEGLRDG